MSVPTGRMLGSVRAAAAAAAPPLSLKHFMLRQQVFSQYRTVLRLSRRCVSPEQRRETISHARQQIEAMKGAQDASHIKALLQDGKRQVVSLENMLNFTK